MPFVELIIVLFVILAVIAPFLTLYLLRKYRKLREDFDNARRAQSSEAANLRREIAELKKQIPSVLALPPAPTVPGEKPLERLTPPGACSRQGGICTTVTGRAACSRGATSSKGAYAASVSRTSRAGASVARRSENSRRCETGGSRCAASREQTACGTGSVSAVATSGSVCATGPAAPRRRNVVNSRGANLHSLAGLGF